MLDFFFKPKSYAKNVYHIDVDQLVQDGYRLLLCDIDNTLVAFDQKKPSEQAYAFFEHCHKVGLQIVLCSNNTKERVGTFAEAAGLDYISFFCKPFPFNYLKLKKKYQISSTQMACTGDQILTDILGGNGMGLHTIFLDPLVEIDSRHTGFSRFFEKYILKIMSYQKKWKKGEYYGYKM